MATLTDRLAPPLWESYEKKSPAAVWSHQLNWSAKLAASYTLPCYHLAVHDDSTGRVSGILPLILFAPPEGDCRLISLPYSDAAGIAADSEDDARELLRGVLALADKLGAVHLELRQAGPAWSGLFREVAQATGWLHAEYDFKTGLKRPLPDTSAQLWAALPGKVRNQVRKASREGCSVTVGGRELLELFYTVFSENMRDLGSPVHACELFRKLFADDSLSSRVVLVSREGAPAAGAIIFQHHQTMTNPWASSLRRFRPYCVNMLLYWSMLEYAITQGCVEFDFGRSSPNASTYRFKCQWGAERDPLVWHVFSKSEPIWDPRWESLSLDAVMTMDLGASRREGPKMRRWISL